MYERDVPNVAGNVAHPVPTETGANGAYCKAGFRSDFLDDKKGQRTGIPGKYTENTFYMTKYIGSTVMFRPELRFDHSWDARGYNAGKSRNQLFFGMDVIYKF